MARYRPPDRRPNPLGVPSSPPAEEDRRLLGKVLSELVGLPLSAFDGEHLSHPSFVFGDPKREWTGPGPVRRVEGGKGWQLHLQCGWRLVDAHAELLSSRIDNRAEREEAVEAFARVLREGPPLVTDVGVRTDAAFRLGLAGGYAIFVLPWDRQYTFSDIHQGERRWLLQTPDGDPRGDLRLQVDGLQWSPKPDGRAFSRIEFCEVQTRSFHDD